MTAWLVLAALGLLAARLVVRPERDSWSIVAVGSDESALLVEYSVANTGLFADQLTTHAALLRRDASTLAHRAIAGPATLDDQGVHGATDGLESEKGGWAWRVEGDALRVRGRATAGAATCPPPVGHGVGFVDMPGSTVGQGQGSSLDRDVLVVRTHAAGNEAGSALYAVDPAGALGLDPQGACPGFLTIGSTSVTGAPPWIPPTPEDPLRLDFAGHTLEVGLLAQVYVDDGADNTLVPERWLAFAVGYRLPRTTLRRVRVSVDGAVPWTGLLVLRERPAPWAR